MPWPQLKVVVCQSSGFLEQVCGKVFGPPSQVIIIRDVEMLRGQLSFVYHKQGRKKGVKTAALTLLSQLIEITNNSLRTCKQRD